MVLLIFLHVSTGRIRIPIKPVGYREAKTLMEVISIEMERKNPEKTNQKDGDGCGLMTFCFSGFLLPVLWYFLNPFVM